MATVHICEQCASRGSQYELSYASPDSKHQNIESNYENGKLGDDGRNRRSWGSSDDEGGLTHDSLHNEDLRVGGPYLCSIPTANIVVPSSHAKYRLMCLQTPEGGKLGVKILDIIHKHHLNQDAVSLCFSFFGRQSIIDPERHPCLTLYVPANRDTLDDTWLQCARELRGLLIDNDLASCSVEIVDPMIMAPMNTYPVLQEDKVFYEWDHLLKELLAQLDLTSIRFIGCFRRGRGPTALDCSPTLLILVDRIQDWTETREKAVSILNKRHLQSLAVQIVMDRPVYHKGGKMSMGFLKGLLENDGMTMAAESIASSQNNESNGTLGCFLSLKRPSSDAWKTFALTCWHVVVPPFAGLSHGDRKLIKNWHKNGIRPNIANADINRLLSVDYPTRLAYTDKASRMEETLRTTESREFYRMWQQLERDGVHEMFGSSNRRQRYEEIKSDVNKQKANLQTLHDQFKNGRQLLGHIFSASGFKRKNIGLGKDGENYSTNLDWALVHFFDRVTRHIPDSLASWSILRTPEMHGHKVFMHGYQSGDSVGVYNGLRVANIQAKMEEHGVVTTVTSLEYSILGVEEEAFSRRGDSGAIVGFLRDQPTGTEHFVIGMVVGGFEKERITRFTRVDFLVDDIIEMTKARDIAIFWFYE